MHFIWVSVRVLSTRLKQNDAVHCITVTKRCEHDIPVLASLNWLPDSSKIDLKTALKDFISKHISELPDCCSLFSL